MEAEAKIIIAFLFNRSGKTALAESEIYLPLSMELGWFSTKEAQEFIAYTLAHKLLVKKEKLLHPAFPVDTISIPVGFTPSKKMFHEKTETQKEEHLIESVISQISHHTKKDAQEIRKEIQHESQEKNIFPEVTVLYLARKYDVDIAEWIDTVEKIVFKESTR
jgi:hypothetical protein